MESITTTIRPNRATFGQTTKLSTIDQIAPRDYVATYFFFHLPENIDNSALFRVIEQGFHTMVQQIPQLMCCICKSDNNRDELELRLHEDSGAVLSLKDFTCPNLKRRWSPGTFADLERDHFPLARVPREHMLAQTDYPGQHCWPSLALQANFLEGGLVLTGCLHHTVCDGTGNFIFYSMFAQYISAAAAKRTPDPLSDSVISFLDRKSIIQPEVEVELDELLDWKLVASDEDFLNPCGFDPEQNPPVQYATYYISKADLGRLRQTLHTESGLASSTTESICAFLWMHVVKARNINCEKYPETKLSVTVNTRTRMSDPECSPAYWGNLSEPNAVARMPTSQFCGPPEEDSLTATEVPLLTTGGLQGIYSVTGTIHPQSVPLSDASNNDYASLSSAAARVKQALAAVDNTAVRRLVGLINQLPTSTSLTWNVDRWPGPDMLIVCLNGTKFNHIDFGPALGCSEAFRATVGLPEGKPDGRCFILPPRASDNGGLEVMLQYDAETLRRLRECVEFREFLEWRN